MLKHILGWLAFLALAAGVIAGVAFYTSPQSFRAQMALLTKRDGPTAYLVLEVDTAHLQREQLEHVADQMASALRVANPPIRYSGRGVSGDAARVRLVDPAQTPQARRALAVIANAAQGAPDTLAFVEHEDGLIEARLPFAVARDNVRLAVAQSMQVISRRVNPTGTLPITVTAIGEDRILVEARGETDSTRLRSLIGPTGSLTFHMVAEAAPEDVAAGRLPPGTMLAQPHPDSDSSPEVVERRPRFTGEQLVRANPSIDEQTGEFVLSFALDGEGTRLFCRITSEHIGDRFAILLDNQVLTAPTIREPICGGGGQISGGFSAESANNLAIMLRAGALPAPLTLVEEGLRPAAPAR